MKWAHFEACNAQEVIFDRTLWKLARGDIETSLLYADEIFRQNMLENVPVTINKTHALATPYSERSHAGRITPIFLIVTREDDEAKEMSNFLLAGRFRAINAEARFDYVFEIWNRCAGGALITAFHRRRHRVIYQYHYRRRYYLGRWGRVDKRLWAFDFPGKLLDDKVLKVAPSFRAAYDYLE